MADSLTDNGNTQDVGSQSSDLPTQDINPSAEDGQRDTGSGDNNADSGQSQDDGENQSQDDGSDDDGLKRFAKAQGFDPENLTDGEKKALKLAHDNQKATRKGMQERSEELKKSNEEVNTPTQAELDGLDDDDAQRAEDRARMARLEDAHKISEFKRLNPEADEYDREMGEILLEEFKAYRNPQEGRQAARALGRDLNRLLTLAKARRTTSDADSIREEGRRQEREEQRRKQEGSGDRGAAQNPATGNNKITRDWVKNEYDPSNAEHRKMIDAAIQRGDLY